MGAGASTMLPELVDKQQAKAAAGDMFDEAAFDAAAVDGRVPRAVLMEISSWLQAIRDGATELDLTGPTLLSGRVGAGPDGSRTCGTMLICARSTRLRRRAPRHGRAVLWSCDACRLGWVLCPPQERASAMSARELWQPCSRGTRRSRNSISRVRGSVLGGGWAAIPYTCVGPRASGGRCRARLALVQLGGARACGRRVPLPGAWLLLVGA